MLHFSLLVASCSHWPIIKCFVGTGGHVGGFKADAQCHTDKCLRAQVLAGFFTTISQGSRAAARNPIAHTVQESVGASSSILKPEFEDLVVAHIPQPLGPLLSDLCLSIKAEYDPVKSSHTCHSHSVFLGLCGFL